jgi:beta-glucosidase
VVYKEGVFVGYRGYDQSEVKPLFPFGFGLSYTTFKYANLSVSSVVEGSGAGGSGPHYRVSFDVMNTGQLAGATVAQVYVAEARASVPRPPKELKGFERVMLQPGETKHVSVELDGRAFAFYDVEGKHWKVDSGEFGILVGDSSADIALKSNVQVREAVVE